MARLIKDLPPKLLTMEKSFDQLLRLLQDPSLAVQISSYDLLQRVVRKHVEDLVVEVELDAEEKIEIGLPTSLLNLLEAKLDTEEIESEERVRFSLAPFRLRVFRAHRDLAQASTYLLSWLTAFAFFGPAVSSDAAASQLDSLTEIAIDLSLTVSSPSICLH